MTESFKICIQRAETRQEWDEMQADYIRRALLSTARIEHLEAALQDTLAYLDQYVDVVDGDNGVPEPNAAMSLSTMIEEVLK